ncbi:proteophosphoglycan 5 [Moesziomyces aphidis]|jgi:DNA polymerase sigma|uniref:Proteophosphoglycan 5 n=1 Tax=Moesziomyces aphidis TaxID=84754 RepID=W3VHU2_MOEAP|nr:proteophosphoglycan 5 [Moesziomyces aphidis]
MDGIVYPQQGESSKGHYAAFSHGGVEGFLPAMNPSSQSELERLPSIEFSASQGFFGQLDSSPTPRPPLSSDPSTSPTLHTHYQSPYATSSRTALSGMDPMSTLGHGSHPAFTRFRDHQQQNSPPARSIPDAKLWNDPAVRGDPIGAGAKATSQTRGSNPTPQMRIDLPSHHLDSEDRARRAAEVDRRNKLREQEKVRRKLEIQKQIDDGFAALSMETATPLQQLQAKRDEEDKLRRRRALEQEIQNGITAIQQERIRQRARVESDRQACRQWLSDLQPAKASAGTSTASHVIDAIDPYLALGRQIRGFWNHSRPPAAAHLRRDEVVADVQRAIDRKWPGQNLKVAAFGSSVTGLLTASSDLDLVLLDPTRPYGVGTPPDLCGSPKGFVRHSAGMPDWYSVHQVAHALRNSNKFAPVQPISGANVPIVKMVHSKHGIPADININERFGLFNSQLISAYADLQPGLVRPLIFFLKHWYSQRDLNDPAGKTGSMTFSSYTIALKALQVLQVEGLLPNLQSPPLLNSLQIHPSFLFARPKRPRRRNEKKSTAASDEAVRGGLNGSWRAQQDPTAPKPYDVTFVRSQIDASPYRAKALAIAEQSDDAPLASAPSPSSTDGADRLLGKMLVAFLRFYSRLDRKAQAISLVNGSPIQRRQSSQPRHILFDSADEDETSEHGEHSADGAEADVWAGDELVVQDPFIVDRNTSRNIKSKSIERWQSELDHALHFLGFDGRGSAPSATKLDDVPLLLDLCIPPDVAAFMEVDDVGSRASAKGRHAAKSKEPWRSQEEAQAQAREIAKQAAEKLRSEKKRRANRAKASEARILREEAAMVQDIVNDMHPVQVSDSKEDNNQHDVVPDRRQEDVPGRHNPIPSTFSVAPSTGKASAPTRGSIHHDTNGLHASEHLAQDLALSPTVSSGTSKTDETSSSEDLDLVALRLKYGDRFDA